MEEKEQDQGRRRALMPEEQKEQKAEHKAEQQEQKAEQKEQKAEPAAVAKATGLSQDTLKKLHRWPLCVKVAPHDVNIRAEHS